ncbi:MAG: C39 family peptidase [Sphingobacteriia bacterium]|nr:C39 family peptidase [Sphingobacteriia bacterium]
MKTNKYISEELLAAFIDGTTTQEQNDYTLDVFKDDPELYKEFWIAYLAANLPVGEDRTPHENNDTSFNGNIPTIIVGGGMAAGSLIGNVFEHSHIPMVAVNSDENNFLDDRLMHHNDSISANDFTHLMEIAIHKAPNQFGEEANNYVSPNVDQGYSDTCAVRSQQLVLNDFGIPVTQEDLIKEATQHGWYTQGEGTPLEYVGNLLENHGVEVNRFENANIFNLTNELAQGHKVIIGVDANELWHNGFWQHAKDSIIGDTPNHALIVAGIDTSDPKQVQVILEDPGTGDVAKAYPMEQFLDAWKDSHCFMVSTQEPAPLAFNQETMMGFDYDKGRIQNSETLMSSVEDTYRISEYPSIDPEPTFPEFDRIDTNHEPSHPGYVPISEEYDPRHPEYKIDKHHPEDDHHDDLDISHLDHNV